MLTITSQAKNGAFGRIWTDDIQFTKLALYQLSYKGIKKTLAGRRYPIVISAN